ncbi:MAG: hypothetical protein HKO02_03150 [Hyphomonadaceae bacterium]|nr:hypothetical protein [Hyphomonadaceae bacterium]
MRTVAELEGFFEGPQPDVAPVNLADEYLRAGEEILENWLIAHDREPTQDKKEGFRILALQRQGSKGDPSFNACRETARELVYHYNLITLNPEHKETEQRLKMAEMVAKHLILFVGGKLQVAGLGEFCCSSKSLRLDNDELKKTIGAEHA